MPRYTVDFDDKFDRNLTKLQEKTGASSRAEVIRNAVAVYSYLKTAVPEVDGVQKVFIKDKDGITNVILPG
jgi:ribosomal protein S17E